MIFVFGSNEAGIHGAGAARTAFQYFGAKWKRSYGHHGHSFAIPTKDWNLQSLSLDKVRNYVQSFLKYAQSKPKQEFQITRIGCGLAGFTDAQIAPLFEQALDNCYFDTAWEPWLPGKKFWGTF